MDPSLFARFAVEAEDAFFLFFFWAVHDEDAIACHGGAAVAGTNGRAPFSGKFGLRELLQDVLLIPCSGAIRAAVSWPIVCRVEDGGSEGPNRE